MSVSDTGRVGPLRYLVIDTAAYRFYLDEDEKPRLIAAIRELDQGGSRWFIFEHLDGRIIHLKVSSIEHFGVSSPENRERFAAMEQEQRDDERQLKPWEDDD